MAPLNESSALTPPTDRAAVVGRRRSTTGLAQAKRKAWGREWGTVVRDYWLLKRGRT